MSASDETTKTADISFEELLVKLKEAFAGDKVDIDHVTALMDSYKSNPADWQQYAQFDKDRYTRNLVDEGNGKFDLIVLCWSESQCSSVHDHGDSHCFLKVLDGEINEVLYETPKEQGKELVLKEKHGVPLNKTAYICNDIGIHRIENPSATTKSASLHLYSPPLRECLNYNEKTGEKKSFKMTFYSKAGKKAEEEKTSTESGESGQTSNSETESK